jgi:acyl carrier protein
MMPSAFVVLDALPLNANGKVNRAALPQPDAQDFAVEESYVPPRTPTEERVARIWSELLGVERVGVTANFFALGGHSLMAMRVLTRLRDDTGLDIPLQSLFDAPTVTGLAERVDTIQWAKGGPDAQASLDNREEVEL